MPPTKTKAARQAALKTFKERLQFLIGQTKPYAWCKLVGIEKGLFQYYWQKGKIPKYENLIKIRDFTGCSLDWLMTGEGDSFPDRLDNMDTNARTILGQADMQIDKLEKMINRLKKLKVEAEKLKKK
ncbi:MAG: helix-turn-helix domain-containing protein [Nitrospinae bacterium]|nr:helix-turn-helix domain-containing protein [Nitrospinota bacterium]